jgi:hypothetical protein
MSNGVPVVGISYTYSGRSDPIGRVLLLQVTMAVAQVAD